jgi:transcription antitermination factor NusG
LEAVVTRVMPGRERVVVLLEFLGRQTKVEVATANVVRLEGERRLVVGQPFQAAG